MAKKEGRSAGGLYTFDKNENVLKKPLTIGF